MDKSAAGSLKDRSLSIVFALTVAALPVTLSSPVLAEDWTGFYAGGQVGHLDADYPSSSPLFLGSNLFEGSGSGLGLHAGYNHDLGDFVIGGEVSVDFPSVDVFISRTGASAPRDVDSIIVAKVKAGYDAGRFLPYAVVGYASQKFADTTATTPGLTFDGATYGLGVSYLASPRLIAGVEVLWFDLDSKESSTLTSQGTLVSLRLSYRF